MAKKFQMLEDLERIIDSGYGESTGELEDEKLEEVNAQKLITLFTS